MKIRDKFLFSEDEVIDLIFNKSNERFYVYIIVNPITRIPFYVGKGQGSRLTTHWYNRDSDNSSKSIYLRKLYNRGYKPLYFIFGFYKDEKRAYKEESRLISHYGIRSYKKGILYNKVFGGLNKGNSLSKEVYIESFKEVHGEKYDYSQVKYVGYRDKIKIICPEHGEFWQRCDSHKNGSGCPRCSGSGALNQKSIIEDFIKVHGTKYNYSKVKYESINEPVVIICPEHGEFYQKPQWHKRGHGCEKCSISSIKAKLTLNQKDVIKSFKKTHKNKYNYCKVKYNGCMIKVEIICPEHGSFFQVPSNHINGQGCPSCAKSELSTKLSKPVIQTDLDGKFLNKYESVSKAASESMCPHEPSIRSVCKGYTKSYRGYIWIYEADYIST